MLKKVTLPANNRTPIIDLEPDKKVKSGLLNRDWLKCFNFLVTNNNEMIDETGCFVFPQFSDVTRPAAGATGGRAFFNTDDGNLNISDGLGNWILPDGTIT